MVVGDRVWYRPTPSDVEQGREPGLYTVVGVYPSARLLGGMTGYRIAREGQPDFPAYERQLTPEKDGEHA